MSNDWSRRELIATIGGALAAPALARAAASEPRTAATRRRLTPPYFVGADNALLSRNAAGTTVAAECLARLARGERTVEAIVAGIEICELDPEDTSVGYGGLPNSDGVVELDAAVMECGAPGTKGMLRAGGVASLQGVRTPARVALAVADRTDHHLLVGAGAQRFARQVGFAIEDDLNTERSRRDWLDWKRRLDPKRWLDPERSSAADESAFEAAAAAARRAMLAEGRLDPRHLFGTIHVSAVGASRDVASVTSTSGLAFKIAGRVGDSPILGAGLWCDAGVGAAGSTGRGEANLQALSSAWIVEELRRGAHPKDAAMRALARVRERNRAAHLRTAAGEPAFSLQFYVLDLEGNVAGASLYRDYNGSIARYAAGDGAGVELHECEALLERFTPDPA
jgi:N4-(beta-N-acetylglucosaminyl)-L-asparaginase